MKGLSERFQTELETLERQREKRLTEEAARNAVADKESTGRLKETFSKILGRNFLKTLGGKIVIIHVGALQRKAAVQTEIDLGEAKLGLVLYMDDDILVVNQIKHDNFSANRNIKNFPLHEFDLDGSRRARGKTSE